MALLLDTALLPQSDRIDALNAAMSTSEVPHLIDADVSGTHLWHRVEHYDLGHGAHLLRTTGTPWRMSRGPRQLRVAAPERLALGSEDTLSTRTHLGAQHVVPAGELFVVDQTSAYGYVGNGGLKRAFVVDYDMLGISVDVVRSAVPRLRRSPLYDLVRSHLAQLCHGRTDLGIEASAMVGTATTELLRALIVTAAGRESPQRRESMEELLLVRMKHYLEHHLTDPRLSAEAVAGAHNISVRHLYQVWAGNDLTLSQWIIRARLEEARRELARTGSAVAIARVARRWWFLDAAHFSRRFRAAYGMSPRGWRHLNAVPVPGQSNER